MANTESHNVPSTAEIVSSLALIYMLREKEATQPDDGVVDRNLINQIAAHAKATQVAETLAEITGDYRWTLKAQRHNRDGNRKQFTISQHVQSMALKIEVAAANAASA